MDMREQQDLQHALPVGTQELDGPRLLHPLLEPAASGAQATGVVVGRLIGMADQGRVPLVTYPGQPGQAALRARSIAELQSCHIGGEVALAFEHQDPARPLVLGVLRGQPGWSQPVAAPGQVEVEADGQRLTVQANIELVLRCGKASLTLRSDGRIELRGETIVSQAAGANRIRGGSVQLN